MLKRTLSVSFLVGMIILSLISARHVSAVFGVPQTQNQQAIQRQQDQEAPTAVTLPTLPVELYTQTATPGPDGYIKHTVLEAQFLYTIATLYDVPVEEILKLNNLTLDSIINPGDVLLIKKIEMPTPEPTETIAELATTQAAPEEAALPFEPTPELTPTNTPIPETSKGLLERVFTNNSRYLAYGIFALVILGVVLLIVSSRRIH